MATVVLNNLMNAPTDSLPFEIITTADGSLTARFGDNETMHSLRGAFSETVYIYGTALDQASLALSGSGGQTLLTPVMPRTLSLGLGLGYVEMLASAYAVRTNEKPKGESFELVDALSESFKAWVFRKPEQLVPHSLYNDVARRTEDVTGVSIEALRGGLAASIEDGTWILRPALTIDTVFEQKFSCVAFDAFSSKSTPELWSREFLDRFLETACEPICVLSTYACTGHLKRALVDAGFTLEIREGYASKRDSTLARRASLK